MSSCCHDPTKPPRADPRDILREQTRYDNLVRDLFTGDPEKILLRLVNESSPYLRELAALRAHYPTVRLHAIESLNSKSLETLELIRQKEPESPFGEAARQRIEQLK
ncbi:MAG: hypothetical protein ACR65R_01925 [Methylomicrobium sp.]